MTEDLSTPGLDVFPEYRNLADLFRKETNELPQELWEWKLPEKTWGAWSIKEQISHTAKIPGKKDMESMPCG